MATERYYRWRDNRLIEVDVRLVTAFGHTFYILQDTSLAVNEKPCVIPKEKFETETTWSKTPKEALFKAIRVMMTDAHIGANSLKMLWEACNKHECTGAELAQLVGFYQDFVPASAINYMTLGVSAEQLAQNIAAASEKLKDSGVNLASGPGRVYPKSENQEYIINKGKCEPIFKVGDTQWIKQGDEFIQYKILYIWNSKNILLSRLDETGDCVLTDSDTLLKNTVQAKNHIFAKMYGGGQNAQNIKKDDVRERIEHHMPDKCEFKEGDIVVYKEGGRHCDDIYEVDRVVNNIQLVIRRMPAHNDQRVIAARYLKKAE